MKSHIPLLVLHSDKAGGPDAPDRFGGLPAGFPANEWPVCAECGKAMSFLARFRHHPERFPLGREGRVLFLFQCESGTCASWEADGGANRVLILEPEQLTEGTATPPDPEVPILPGAWVKDWVEKEDIPAEQAPSAAEWLDFVGGPVASDETGTKLGGQPEWLQMPEPVEPPYRFAAQIDHVLLLGPEEPAHYLATENKDFRTISLSPALDPPAEEMDDSGDDSRVIEFTSFGDGGRGYLFVNPDPKKPDGYFLWQSW
ncbi:hypothetical protein [Staphylospora marina]|uniref:hypothetical protein n=1 Tax=Staphylospora marina TaxID=2490858 RepID=UPI000F5C286D|nr:hypothetical protein [Staphylospora marina]